MEKNKLEDDRPRTLQQLADKWGVSKPTARKWISKIDGLGPRIGNLYNSKQVKMINETVGLMWLFFINIFVRVALKIKGLDGVVDIDDDKPDDHSDGAHHHGGRVDHNGYTYDDYQRDPWKGFRN